MSTQTLYKLCIEAFFSPEKPIEDEIFKVTYRTKNIDTKVFPGGTVHVTVGIGNVMLVGHPIKIKSLQPNETTEYSYSDMKGITGLNVFFPSEDAFKTGRVGTVELYLPDGRKLRKGQLFAAVRVRSHEEISEVRSVKIAAFSLILLIIFQIIDWLVRYHFGF